MHVYNVIWLINIDYYNFIFRKKITFNALVYQIWIVQIVSALIFLHSNKKKIKFQFFERENEWRRWERIGGCTESSTAFDGGTVNFVWGCLLGVLFLVSNSRCVKYLLGFNRTFGYL